MQDKTYKLICNLNELQLKGTLNGGQSFRWSNYKTESGDDEWVGVFSNRLWILQEKKDGLHYRIFEKSKLERDSKRKKIKTDHEHILKNYFQLDYKMKDYYQIWANKDENFKEAAEQFYGIRILKQDVVENIFSFICSSNNNIKRISSMVHKLSKLFGDEICTYGAETYHSFPTVEALAQPGVEEILKKNGFGYRAKYISKSAEKILKEGGNFWLDKLKQMKYEEAKASLMTLTGIGAKVADCICLMSLGHLQAIPVDTHIFQIAKKFYLPNLESKALNKKVYNEIGDHFRELYGPLAGWAHTVLFCADLKKFQNNHKSV